MNLVIDPGHGGRKPGAVAGGLIEKELVLAISHRVARGALDLGLCTSVVLTRREDVDVTHPARGDLSKGRDLLISIHANAADFRARGLMAFYWPGNAAGKLIAGTIQRSAPPWLASRSRKKPYAAGLSWPRVRYVLKHHRPTAVLVELGFLTNGKDAAALRSEAIQGGLVACILTGIAAANALKERA